LFLAACAILGLDAALPRSRSDRSEEFQRLVGGLGFGPALDLARCPFSFDPRLGNDCAQNDQSLPGCERYCPRHAGSIFYYPPLNPSRAARSSEE
jgi:hypothetical protein